MFRKHQFSQISLYQINSKLFLFRMVPESPRWLVTKGRFDEALKILKGGARMNKKTLPSDNEMLEMMEKIKLQDEQDAPPEEEVKTFKEKVQIIFNQL